MRHNRAILYRQRKGIFLPLTFQSEVTGSHHGQTDGTIMVGYYKEDGSVITYGYLDWSEYEGIIYINMIKVYFPYRRRGIATALYNKLKQENPGQEIRWGMMTEEGILLKRSLRNPRGGNMRHNQRTMATLYGLKLKLLSDEPEDKEDFLKIMQDLGLVDPVGQISRRRYTFHVPQRRFTLREIEDILDELYRQNFDDIVKYAYYPQDDPRDITRGIL